ncbi:MAG TPA: ABC transporter permease [Gaiellales bacterium]|nr:ABC transporter permease [Gaiellales bacterium]
MTGAQANPLAELAKLSAFLRRDVLTRLSYRTAILADWFSLFSQALIFYYVSKVVNPARIPSSGGQRTTYIAYVTVGIAVSGLLAIGLARLVNVIRQEQFMGTLESLMVTPTTASVILLGSVVYDLIYVPFRTIIFLVIVSVGFDVSFVTSGYVPALVILAAFIPFVWGIGSIASACVLTFRRGTGVLGFATFVLTFTSGAYFPVSLFPSWVGEIAKFNPIAVAITGMREQLIGGAGWDDALTVLAKLIPMSGITLLLGLLAFRLAMRRERRLGTLGLY